MNIEQSKFTYKIMDIKDLIRVANASCKYMIVFDLESTGLNTSKDRIIQIAAMKINVETNAAISKINLMLNPGNSNIGLGAYIKTGIVLEDLIDKQKFIDIAQDVVEFFGHPDEIGVAGYNIKNFDIPLLNNELARCGLKIDWTNRFIFDCFEYEKRLCPNTMSSVFEKYYKCTPEFAGLNPHDANADIKATWCIMKKQADALTSKPDDLNLCISDDNNFIEYRVIHDTSIAQLKGTKHLVPVRGKYYGCPVEIIKLYDPSYIDWMLGKVSPLSIRGKQLLRQELGM